MGRIPEHIIEQVRAAHAIEDIVGRTVELKRKGASLWACCPFHEEKTPSFHVEPNRQIFKCFGCGKGGNVFHFVMESHGLTFPEAVRQLAEERGIEVPTTGGAPQDRNRQTRLREALAHAARWFQHHLASDAGAAARTYLAGRGYDETWQERFGLGFAPKAWDGVLDHLRQKGYPPELVADAGLALERRGRSGHYDRFRGRIMFPVHDLHERVVTFGARALDPEDEPKYLNGPETEVFHKSALLFAIHRAQKAMRARGEALVMEGYTDVLMAHRFGFHHTVATMGTALTPQQARLLRRYAQRIVLVYDGDEAGQSAAERGVGVLLDEGLEVRIATLPRGRDVDEILLEEGAEGFQAVLDAQQEFFRFLLSRLGEREDLGSAHGRARALEALVPYLLRVRPLIQDQLVRELARELGGLDTEIVLREEIGRQADRRRPAPTFTPRRTARSPSDAGPDPDAPDARPVDPNRLLTEGCVLAHALSVPASRDGIFRALGVDDFTDPAHQRLYNALLDLNERGNGFDAQVLMDRLADDAEVVRRLAHLPLDERHEETIERHIRFLEGSRRQRRAIDELMALAAARFDDPGRRGPTSAGNVPRNPTPVPDVEDPAHRGPAPADGADVPGFDPGPPRKEPSE